MKVYGLWWGGHSYAMGELEEYLEVFPSIKQAKIEFENRYRLGYSWKQTFNFANGKTEHVFCPTVGEESEMVLYFHNPNEVQFDPYPDRVIKFGPKGGVKVEHV